MMMLYLFDIQDNLQSNFHSPWAIGLGVGIHFKRGIIHLSGEWYDKVPRYTLIETAPFTGQSTGEEMHFRLVDELDPVFNYGIGVELNLSEKISFYASFATDYSGVTSNIMQFSENKQEANNSVFRADFYRFGGGFSLNTKWAEVTLGADLYRSIREVRATHQFSGWRGRADL